MGNPNTFIKTLVLIVMLVVVLLMGNANTGLCHGGQPYNVTYDQRSLIINGSRELLFSGSVHYPRTTPHMWGDIIKKAKQGGLNLIQTYVFWNIHEPVLGQFNFEGDYDLVKFVRLIGENGLWVTLRIGPYIEAEWNMGGFPYWLKEVDGIVFRSDNKPFKYHMKRYTQIIVNLMKKNRLFADQGGPIILAQIENEYNNIQLSYKENGQRYVKWAADMAVSAYQGIPWLMCKQKDAPRSVISTCNGRHCAETFPGPNGPNKPFLWTENWTSQYRVFGDSPAQRSAEDIAFAVATFFTKNGTLNNYYMYYGGTNLGRTASSFVTPGYYDEAPIDEFGLKRDTKFGHLRDLHKALRMSKKPLLWGSRSVRKLNSDIEITTYQSKKLKVCAAFFTNNNTRQPATINFRGVDYYLPPKSVSILPDCKTVVYNTQTIVAQHSSRQFVVSRNAKLGEWEMFKEPIPTIDDLEVKSEAPKEMYSFTRDASDYAWYSTAIDVDLLDLPMRPDIRPVLHVVSLGHALAGFVNGEYIGFKHGSHDENAHVFRKSITLKPGLNNITLLAMTVGLPNSGAYMEKRFAGPRRITIEGLMSGTIDITDNIWGQQVGVKGEKMQVFTEEGSKKVEWAPGGEQMRAVTWYKTYLYAPEGNDPVAIRLSSMGKGMVWINGESIGRYWVSYLSVLREPTQQEYHIPRSFLKPQQKNLLVVFEETGGIPQKIDIVTVNRNTICTLISEFHPPTLNFLPFTNPVKAAHLTCPDDNMIINKIEFLNFGTHEGACGHFRPGNCTSTKPHQLVQQLCMGKNSCTIPFQKQVFLDAADECPGVAKTLAIQLACVHVPNNRS